MKNTIILIILIITFNCSNKLEITGKINDTKTSSQQRIYDKNGNLIRKNRININGKLENDRLGVASIHYKYDSKGNLIERTSYNLNGDIIIPDLANDFGISDNSSTPFDPAIIRYSYDKKGNKITETFHDEKGELMNIDSWGIKAITRYEYNEKSQLVKMSFYDVNNSLSFQGEMPQNSQIVFSYDSKGNLTQKKYLDHRIEKPISITSFNYNKNGQLISDSFWNYKYDEKENLVEKWNFKKDGSIGEKLIFKYNNKNELIEKSDCTNPNKVITKKHGVVLNLEGWKWKKVPTVPHIEDLVGEITFFIEVNSDGIITYIEPEFKDLGGGFKWFDYKGEAIKYECLWSLNGIKLIPKDHSDHRKRKGKITFNFLNLNDFAKEY